VHAKVFLNFGSRVPAV